MDLLMERTSVVGDGPLPWFEQLAQQPTAASGQGPFMPAMSPVVGANGGWQPVLTEGALKPGANIPIPSLVQTATLQQETRVGVADRQRMAVPPVASMAAHRLLAWCSGRVTSTPISFRNSVAWSDDVTVA